jgi:sarcosine oxidase
MATSSYDAIVVGIGAMGSAACAQLARRGRRVLGLERFDIPHAMGSSHGVTRIIRLAYYEHPAYVPLLRRAYTLWRDTEAAFGEQLLHITGSIDASPAGDEVFQGSLRSCLEHDIPHDVLSGDEINRRFPGYRLPADYQGVYQPDGGFVLSERAIVAHVTLAQAAGAAIHAREPITAWSVDGAGVRVETDRAVYHADRLILTTGAWIGRHIPALATISIPERQVLAWFQPTEPSLFGPDRLPVFNLKVSEGRYYGLPVFSVPGFKLGRYHHRGETVDPETFERESDATDEAVLRQFAERYFPAGAGPTMALRSCLFTNTPDEHFILDQHPDHPQVVVASPCSGHGYKFASVIGEILADLAERGATDHDIDLFRATRFASG